MIGLTRGEYDSEDTKRSEGEKGFLMTSVRDLMGNSRGFLSRLREPTAAEDAVWLAIKDSLESMGEVVDTLKEGAFAKINTESRVCTVSGICTAPGWTKFCVCDGGFALGREK